MPETMHPRGFSESLTTKRGQYSAGKRTAPVAQITTPVRCSPILPLDSTAQLEAVGRGVSVDYQVFCDPVDIVPEDVIVVSTEEFTVIEVMPWPRVNPRLLQLTLREFQQP